MGATSSSSRRRGDGHGSHSHRSSQPQVAQGSMQAAEASTGFSGNNAFIFPPIESNGSGLPPPAKPHKSRSNKNASQQQDSTGGNVGMGPPVPLGSGGGASH